MLCADVRPAESCEACCLEDQAQACTQAIGTGGVSAVLTAVTGGDLRICCHYFKLNRLHVLLVIPK